MTKKQFVAGFFAVLLIAVSSCAQQWRTVSTSRQGNISGMALVEHDKQRTVFLVIHDNKKKDQVHASLLTVSGPDSQIFTPLKWVGEEIPRDLEAASAIPGVLGQFILLASPGRAFHVKLDEKAAQLELVKAFDFPSVPPDADFEAFAVQKIDNMFVAVWADRGLTERPATLFSARFDVTKDSFSDVRSATFRVPYPAANVRHISDVKVDPSGGVFVTSASDPGNDGPFSSALYFAGVIRPAADKSFVFVPSPEMTRLYRFDQHKVEAFDFVPGPDGGMAFGTDDENLGAFLWLTY